MPQLTVAKLAALGGRDYVAEVKANLRDDDAWVIFLHPALEARTRWALNTMIESIKMQIERNGTDDEKWLRGATFLKGMAEQRRNRMAPEHVDMATVPGSKEARAWRGFAARVTRALVENDQDALDTLQAPYGGLTARQWLSAREEKRA